MLAMEQPLVEPSVMGGGVGSRQEQVVQGMRHSSGQIGTRGATLGARLLLLVAVAMILGGVLVMAL